MTNDLNTYKEPLEEKAKLGFRGYPIATIAFYGPDDLTATKIAVGIILGKDQEPAHLQRWHSIKDIRRDTEVWREISEFVTLHKARSVAMPTEIMGCPHEEGIDYPLGGYCPKCPFWKDRIRWIDEVAE